MIRTVGELGGISKLLKLYEGYRLLANLPRPQKPILGGLAQASRDNSLPRSLISSHPESAIRNGTDLAGSFAFL
jgi:hypothetical protein